MSKASQLKLQRGCWILIAHHVAVRYHAVVLDSPETGIRRLFLGPEPALS